MVTAMNGIEKQAAYYRAYLADDRSLVSVAGVLVIAVAVWLLFYLVSLVGPAPEPLRSSHAMGWRPSNERTEASGGNRINLTPYVAAPHAAHR